jgi:XTP/dITP diphosphohydrolase
VKVWLASGNRDKRKELEAILAGHILLLPEDAGITEFDPDESGASFAENALIKAKALHGELAARGISAPVLADDSGLCVDALGGRPGIYSARYGSADGKKLESAERNALLLEEARRAGGKRSCRFVCAMVLLVNTERFRIVQETMEGELVDGPEAARGTGGFGYDPIVFLPDKGCTVAELTETEKNARSHRGKAAKLIAHFLEG